MRFTRIRWLPYLRLRWLPQTVPVDTDAGLKLIALRYGSNRFQTNSSEVYFHTGADFYIIRRNIDHRSQMKRQPNTQSLSGGLRCAC
jgi:hypothetical protein